MEVTLERFDKARHDGGAVAALLYQTDPQLMSMVFGSQSEAVPSLRKLLAREHNQYAGRHVTCALHEGHVVGVLAGYDGRAKRAMEAGSARDWPGSLGLWRLLKTMPRALAIARTTTKALGDDDYYISALCVGPRCRGCGVGSRLLEHALRDRGTVRTDVSIHNPRALAFYRRHGFAIEAENTVRWRGRTIGHHAIARAPSAAA